MADYAGNAQYQPPQMASHNLVIRSVLPEAAQAYEISPGEVKVLDRVRGPGGTQITLPDFGTTAMILCTTDPAWPTGSRPPSPAVRPLAVQLAIEQAELMFQAVSEINGRLAADGQRLVRPRRAQASAEGGHRGRPTDERDLLAKAEASIKSPASARNARTSPWPGPRPAGPAARSGS